MPAFRFFSTPELNGHPVIELDAVGLRVDSKLRCTWVDVADGERLLGFLADANGIRTNGPGCLRDLPIYTQYTDAGFGSPDLFIAVRSTLGTRGAIRFRGRDLYFDLTELPGDPREGEPAPVRLPPKGIPGWNWLASQRSEDRRMGAALAKRLADESFAQFYHGLRSCLMSNRPGCLTHYLAADFDFTPWWSSSSEVVHRQQFARFAWQSAPDGMPGRSLWREIAWCFLRGRFDDGGGELVFFRRFIQCSVTLANGRYGVTNCDAFE